MKESLAWCLCVLLVIFVRSIVDAMRQSRHTPSSVISEQRVSSHHIDQAGKSVEGSHFRIAFRAVKGAIAVSTSIDTSTAAVFSTDLAGVKSPWLSVSQHADIAITSLGHE